MSALEVTDVVVRFGGNLAVDDVSITAEPGNVTGLIGAHRCAMGTKGRFAGPT